MFLTGLTLFFVSCRNSIVIYVGVSHILVSVILKIMIIKNILVYKPQWLQMISLILTFAQKKLTNQRCKIT